MDESLFITLDEITGTILLIIADCYEAYVAAREEPEEYERIAMAALLHWQHEVNRILESNHPNIGDLHALNDLLSCLTTTPEEYEQTYAEQLEDLYNACYDYEPFEQVLEGDFGTTLNDYLELVVDYDENIPQSQYMVVG